MHVHRTVSPHAPPLYELLCIKFHRIHRMVICLGWGPKESTNIIQRGPVTISVRTIFHSWQIRKFYAEYDSHVPLPIVVQNSKTWGRHQMETFSALLALCAGNPPVIDGFPHKGQWRKAFDVFFICAWTNGWANTRAPSRSLWRHCNEFSWNEVGVVNYYWPPISARQSFLSTVDFFMQGLCDVGKYGSAEGPREVFKNSLRIA